MDPKRLKQAKRGTHHGALSEDIGPVLRAAADQGLISSSTRPSSATTESPNGNEDNSLPVAALFYDLDAFDDSLTELATAFPPPVWRHCLAVKANPLRIMLEMAVKKGFGLECASLTEVMMSLQAGCEPHMVVFDSPCKTLSDLRKALSLGVQINCDGLEEVDRVKSIVEGEGLRTSSVVGIRVNPLLGFGNIKALSVSDATSKFGVPYTDENKKRIIQLFNDNTFLNALHVHVGSQGCSMEMLAQGAATIYNLAENELGGPARIKVLDIGGGLPTNFDSDETKPSFASYSAVVQKTLPALFDSTKCKYTCVTEFGRSIQAKLGWTVSICELVKEAGGRRIAVVHVGSDMFVRTCYCPKDFPLRVQVVDGKEFEMKQLGEEATKTQVLQNVVGPLCFGGDKICEAAVLPTINQNDFVVIRDSGANCLSLWSRHCSRQSPPVYGYRLVDGRVEFTHLRRREPLSRVMEFWE